MLYNIILLFCLFADDTGIFEKDTFKEFIEQNRLKKIDFLKVDCEGGEYDVFSIKNIKYTFDARIMIIPLGFFITQNDFETKIRIKEILCLNNTQLGIPSQNKIDEIFEILKGINDNNFKSAYSALTINTLNKEEGTIFEKSTEDYLRREGRAFNYKRYFSQEYVTYHDEIYESSECFTDLSNKATIANK